MNKCLVIGSINVDFTLHNVDKFPQENEEVDVGSVSISAGGKSRNIAEMVKALSEEVEVTFFGKVAHDPYGLFKIPLDALQNANVITDEVMVIEDDHTLPGMAFIPVDNEGHNAIYVYGGANDLLSRSDIDEKIKIIDKVAESKGYIVLTMEMPLETVFYVAELAKKRGIKVFLEPGGIRDKDDVRSINGNDFFFIKPNHTEAEILTGIDVNGFDSAEKAAGKLLDMGFENVMITLGSKGALLMNNNIKEMIEVKDLGLNTDSVNETGSGDQVMAGVVAFLMKGYSIVDSVKNAVTAGTIQYHKPNIKPVTFEEIEPYLS